MFYWLASVLSPHWSWLRLFRYGTVRAIGGMLTALAISLIAGRWFLNWFGKRVGSQARENTPNSHLAKHNTPTMGGLFILAATIASMLLWNNLSHPIVWLFVAALFGFGAIGFWDDYSKIKTRRGISAKLKFLLQTLVATTVVLGWYLIIEPPTELCFPFIKTIMPTMGWLIIPWAVFVIIGCSNAVNLTDGLDGLVAGPLIFSLMSYAAIAYLVSQTTLANYLVIPHTNGIELAVCAAAVVGSLLGFLWYNAYPAEVFMGDVGSLSLGAALAFIAIATRQELLLPIIGGIFVVEAASVIAQVISFRLTGKRIFRMAPLHHHFELMGWNEIKVTIRFWIVSIVLCILALLTLKIR